MAINGSSHFVPVPKETTRARVRPGSKLWPSTGEGLCPVPHLYDNAMAIDGSSCFAPSPICTIMLRPSTGAATSCLSLSWVIMRLPGRGFALVVGYGHRRGRGFAPSPICTIMLWPSTGEELRPVPHWGNNEDYQGEGSPWQ